uniref:Secreted protein n=1 Tax=Panstrongylus lignarius TaxID=156445 RepID=A0A224XUQ2_9HEMI
MMKFIRSSGLLWWIGRFCICMISPFGPSHSNICLVRPSSRHAYAGPHRLVMQEGRWSYHSSATNASGC